MTVTDTAIGMVSHLRANPDDTTAWLAYADAIEETHPHFAEHVRVIRGVLPGAAISCFGGQLTRIASGRYEWSDGAAEPRVREGTISAHNFRVSAGRVEVPRPVAQRRGNAEIRWVVEGCDLGWLSRCWHAGRNVDVIYVPVAEWDAHAAALPCSVEWDQADEAAILAKAASLGAVVPAERKPFTAR